MRADKDKGKWSHRLRPVLVVELWYVQCYALYFGHGLDRIVELDRTLVYELMPRLFILDFF